MSEAAARIGFLMNMMATTAHTVIKSGIKVVTLLDSTSLRALISPMIRASILPVGRLSKKVKIQGLNMRIQLLADINKYAVAYFSHNVHTQLYQNDQYQIQGNGKGSQLV